MTPQSLTPKKLTFETLYRILYQLSYGNLKFRVRAFVIISWFRCYNRSANEGTVIIYIYVVILYESVVVYRFLIYEVKLWF